jgi:hypothetical protein
VQFEITQQTRSAIGEWLAELEARKARYLFLSRFREQPHISGQQYARIFHRWVAHAGLDSTTRTRCAARSRLKFIRPKICERCCRCWGTELESTVRCLGIEVNDALSISEQVEP